MRTAWECMDGNADRYGMRTMQGTEWKERWLNSHFASSARAIIPAASGAEALVPVWRDVQTPCMSVVTCGCPGKCQMHSLVLYSKQ